MATIWETRLNNHGLWPVVDQLRDALTGVDAPDDVDGRDALARLLWFVDVLQTHRDNEDARGYTPTMLDTVQRLLVGNVQTNVNQFLADPGSYLANLQTAAQQVDSVLDQMASWPPLSPRGAAQSAGRAYASYVEATNAAFESFSTSRDTLSAEVAMLKTTITDEQAALAKVREDFEGDADKAIRMALEELSAKYVEDVQTSVKAISADEQSARSKRERLDQMEQEGNRILEAVANKAVAHDYRENARNKAVAGWVWDLAGLLVGGAPLVLLLIHFFQIDPSVETPTSLTLTRLGISTAAVGLAALCFHRGSANHKESRRAKRADIRLSTAKPFIANQDEDFQKAIVQGMADRIYLQGILDDGDATADESLLKKALERVRATKAGEVAVE